MLTNKKSFNAYLFCLWSLWSCVCFPGCTRRPLWICVTLSLFSGDLNIWRTRDVTKTRFRRISRSLPMNFLHGLKNGLYVLNRPFLVMFYHRWTHWQNPCCLEIYACATTQVQTPATTTTTTTFRTPTSPSLHCEQWCLTCIFNI